MQVVGIDFGTSNVRIATWDSNGDLPPEPKPIGNPDGVTMPAVVALRRQAGGEIDVIVGEEADSLDNVENEIEVIRNIKRYALSEDKYVRWHLEVRDSHEDSPRWPQSWWDPATSSVHVWGQTFTVWDLIHQILAEAFRRAGIGGEFEWRAGCPVHANLAYRQGLAQTLSRVTGQSSPSGILWIVEEPILFLTLVHRMAGASRETRLNGSYLVYDLGGGSFDSALVEIREDTYDMVVYGADGHPLLGGSDIDEDLRESIHYSGQPDLLRKAKERLTPSNPSEQLADGTLLTLGDVNRTMENLSILRKSLMTSRDAYIAAKTLWKRAQGDDDPPVGELLTQDDEGNLTFVWQLTWEDLARDVDKIVLVGGPTRSPGIREELARRFGDDKVVTAADLLPTLAGTPDLELVGISMGACYSYDGSHVPWHLNRLPFRITLEDMETGAKKEYEPFQSFSDSFKPFSDFISEPLKRQTSTLRSPRYPETYQLTVAYPTGLVLQQRFIDNQIDPSWLGHELRLVIDQYGRVGVEQSSPINSKAHAPGPVYKRTAVTVFQDTSWQIEEQREALLRLFEQQSRYHEDHREQGLLNFNRLPWQYPTP